MCVEIPGEYPVQIRYADVMGPSRRWNHVQHPGDQLVVATLGRRLQLPELFERVAMHQGGSRGGVDSHARDRNPAARSEAIYRAGTCRRDDRQCALQSERATPPAASTTRPGTI